MKVYLYKMECLTNMHVGSGDVNYNIIDNEVERDPVTGLPTINSSGVKGALRNHFKLSDAENIEQFFGSEHYDGENGNTTKQDKSKEDKSKQDKSKQDKSKPGNCKFLNANLLLRPMRVSKGNRPYVLVTTKEILEQFKEHTSNFGITNSFFELNEDKLIIEKKEMVEGYNVRFLQGVNSSFIDSQIAVMEHKDYKSVDLPVIARNHLENGISQNLWYEEIVPHKSVFYFTVLATDGIINDYIDGEMIQFGGNASIGYGLTKITKIGER